MIELKSALDVAQPPHTIALVTIELKSEPETETQ
jgi:hypothetical protein